MPLSPPPPCNTSVEVSIKYRAKESRAVRQTNIQAAAAEDNGWTYIFHFNHMDLMNYLETLNI